MRSMVVYGSFLDATRNLPPETFKELWTAVLDYGIDGIEPEELGMMATSMFELIRPNVDANIRRRKGRKNCENLPIKNNNCLQLSTIASKACQSSIDGDGEYIDVDIKNNRHFIAPSVEEVAQYIREKGYHFTAEEFVAFYSAKGWMMGKNKMKSWRQACVTWEARRKADAKAKRPQIDQHEYDFDAIERALIAAQG